MWLRQQALASTHVNSMSCTDISFQSQDLAPTSDVRQFWAHAVNFLIHDCMSKCGAYNVISHMRIS